MVSFAGVAGSYTITRPRLGILGVLFLEVGDVSGLDRVGVSSKAAWRSSEFYSSLTFDPSMALARPMQLTHSKKATASEHCLPSGSCLLGHKMRQEI